MSTPNRLALKAKLPALVSRLQTRFGGKTLLALAAVLFAVFYRTNYRRKSKKRGLVTDLSAVGSPEDEKALLGYNDYDVIIVGGGTSGCVLASRLSEDPSLSVLLLEAGDSGCALPESRIPAASGALYHSPIHTFPLYTEPQEFANGKRKFWPRGKMLGGCSSINAQMAQYGAPEDFDEWARIIGDDSWSWINLNKYFRKFEKYTPDKQHPLVDASVRGSSGPVRVGYFNMVSNSVQAFIDACVRVGIRCIPDFNGPKGPLGVSRIMTYVDDKYARVSSESAYLTPEVLARHNLKVAVKAHVTRIRFETIEGKTRATGVEFTGSASGPRYASAKNEVILSAGAIHSPQLLMLSGIGAAQDLIAHGIPVVKDLPGVGGHLVDHPVVDLCFEDKSRFSLKFFKPETITDVLKAMRAVIQYKIGMGGPFAMNFGEVAAFVRSDDPILFPPDQFPEKLIDTTSSANSPDLELIATPFAYRDHGAITFDVPTRGLHAYLLRPASHGKISLKTANPFDAPSIDPRYLEAPDDVEKLVRGVKLCLRIAQAEPFEPYMELTSLRSDFDHALHLLSDEELSKLITERIETLYHPTSTCRMAPLAENGVVDSQLRVYGIEGLRVCDASVFSNIVSGHPAATCFAVAEKLAEEMKAGLR